MKDVCERAVKLAREAGAAEATATLTWSRHAHLRFALNEASTSGDIERRALELHAAIGQRQASATTEDLSPGGLADLAEDLVDLVKRSPEDPEHLPGAGPQRYARIAAAFDAATAEMSPQARARAVGPVLEASSKAGLVAAGFHEVAVTRTWRLSSTGASGTHENTRARLSATVRRADGTASGWAGAESHRLGAIDGQALARAAVERCKSWVDPTAVEPGPALVLLDPAAVAGLLGSAAMALDARTVDEGRSAFARIDIGQKAFADGVSLISAPDDPVAPGSPWGEGGFAAQRHAFIEGGALRELRRTRHWAKKTGKPATITGGTMQLAGGTASRDELWARAEGAIYIPHVWYVRMLDPQTLSVTGVTRDSIFRVEKGKPARALKTFRFNQSITDMLKNVVAIGKDVELHGRWAAPALLVKDFHVSASSDAV